jgi:hypothetical protein
LGSHLRTKQINVWQINDHKGGQTYQAIEKMKFWKELSKQ